MGKENHGTLRHYFISLSKGVDFLEAKPFASFLSLPHSCHVFGGNTQHGPSIHGLSSVSGSVTWITIGNSCTDFSFTDTE